MERELKKKYGYSKKINGYDSNGDNEKGQANNFKNILSFEELQRLSIESRSKNNNENEGGDRS